MQPLIYAVGIAAVVAIIAYEVVHYIPYIISHITEILAHIAVGLVVVGTGYFITHFGIVEENK
jgi:hypothetical protein